MKAVSILSSSFSCSISEWVCAFLGRTVELLNCNRFRLHHEIKHFYEAMSPTQTEISARESLLKRVSDVVTKLWTGAKVGVFTDLLELQNCI